MTIGESGDPRDRIANQRPITYRSVTGPEQHAATVRKCHADAMMALAADVHPYSAEAIRQQEEALDAALDELVALAGRADELAAEAECELDEETE